MRKCSDCGREVSEQERPCRTCGSSRQTIEVTATSTLHVRGGLAGMSVKRGPVRPWYERWHSVRQHLQAVESATRRENYRGNEAIICAFEDFFIQCDSLAGWLGEDPTTGLTTQQVRADMNTDADWHIASGVAIVAKHLKRNRPGITATIEEVGWDDNGVHASVRWTENRVSGTEDDALGLARRCVAAWERYLKSKGLQSPI